VFPNVDLAEKEWCDFDENEDREVGIYDVKSKFITVKG